jgi:hypothetical protein
MDGQPNERAAFPKHSTMRPGSPLLEALGGDTPLQRAINGRKHGVSQLLLERGAPQY